MVGSPLSFCMVRFVEAGSATLLSQVPYIIKQDGTTASRQVFISDMVSRPAAQKLTSCTRKLPSEDNCCLFEGKLTFSLGRHS